MDASNETLVNSSETNEAAGAALIDNIDDELIPSVPVPKTEELAKKGRGDEGADACLNSPSAVATTADPNRRATLEASTASTAYHSCQDNPSRRGTIEPFEITEAPKETRMLSAPLQDKSACQQSPGPATLNAEDQMVCRLCFEGDEDAEGPDVEPLIAPCQCSGSMRWVHQSCINQWRYHGHFSNPKAMTNCPTCQYEYRLYCTFDIHEDQRRKGKRRRRFCRDFLLVFMAAQAFLFLIALIIRECDKGERISKVFGNLNHRSWTKHHWWSDFFTHHLFHYYSAAILTVLFLIGIGTILVSLLQCACPNRCRRGADAREVHVVRRRQTCLGQCCQDCERSCICYDPMPMGYGGTDCCPCEGCNTHSIACDGEGAIVLLGLAVVAVIVLGLFVALFLFSAALQRMGQRYLRVLHLKDVAERYAVLGYDEDPPLEVEINQSFAVETPPDVEAPPKQDGPSQEEIRAMLRQEIESIKGFTHATHMPDAPVQEQ